MPEPDDVTSAQIPFGKPILSYRGPVSTSAVTVRRCANLFEAQFCVSHLTSHDIDGHLLNENVSSLGPYSGYRQVEVQVPREQVKAALELLAQLGDANDVEPAEPDDPTRPLSGPDGNETLIAVATYPNARELRRGAAILGAARVECVLPKLVPRRDGPIDVQKRFVLRVAEEDVDRARSLLRQAADDPDDEPRCPACGSWRASAAPLPWRAALASMFGVGASGPQSFLCQQCGHRWTI